MCNNMIRYLPRSLASNKHLPFVAFVREIIICLDSQANLWILMQSAKYRRHVVREVGEVVWEESTCKREPKVLLMSRNKRWFEIISKPLNKKAKKHLNEMILPGLCPLYYYYLHNELLEEGISLVR